MLLDCIYCYLIQHGYDTLSPSADARDRTPPGPSFLFWEFDVNPGRLGALLRTTHGSATEIHQSEDRVLRVGGRSGHTRIRSPVLDPDHRPGSGRRPATTHRRCTERPLPPRADPPLPSPALWFGAQGGGHDHRPLHGENARSHSYPSPAPVAAPVPPFTHPGVTNEV